MRWHLKASGLDRSQTLLDLEVRARGSMLPDRAVESLIRAASAAMDDWDHGFAVSAFGETDSGGLHDLHLHVRVTV